MKHALAIVAILALSCDGAYATVLRDYTVVTESTSFGAATLRALVVECPEGTSVLSGGADTTAGGGAVPRIRASGPTVDRRSWVASARNPPDAGGWRLTVTAICGDLLGSAIGTEATEYLTTSSFGFSFPCPDGKRAVSGGVQPFGDAAYTSMFRSIALGDSAWYVGVRGYDTGEWGVRADVICVDPADDIVEYSISTTENGAPEKEVSIVCPAGTSVLGGGAEAVLDNAHRALTANGPHFEGGEVVGWRAAAGAFDPLPPDWRLDVMVVCPETAHGPLALAALAALRLRGAASSRARATRACRRP